jgi:hypothetical protein
MLGGEPGSPMNGQGYAKTSRVATFAVTTGLLKGHRRYVMVMICRALARITLSSEFTMQYRYANPTARFSPSSA